MPGGKRDGLIEKEQLRVTSLGHHRSVTAPEFQNACNPTPAFVAAHYFSVAFVQCAPTVAHHRAASVCPKDVAAGAYAVFEWHAEINIMPYPSGNADAGSLAWRAIVTASRQPVS
jgi:hypothetical protein